jgi:hypothetical protein
MSLAPQSALHAPPTLSRCDLILLRAGASIVPAGDRDDWRRNWHAELWHMHHRRRRIHNLPSLSSGLLRDALWLRAESWRRAYTGTAILCLASLTGLCAIAALVGLAACGWEPFRALIASRLIRFLIESPLVVAVTFATSSSRYIDQRPTGRTLCWIRRQLFLAAKIALLLVLAFLLSTDLCLPLFARAPMTSEVVQVFVFAFCAIAGLMWAFRDQDQRCKHCLCALSSPASVGRPSHNLLEWTGTRQACRFGHGVFSVPEMLSSWRQHSHWVEGMDLGIGSGLRG